MSESYCLTVKDAYGAPLSDLRAPEGWEFTGEFRPPLRGEEFLGAGRAKYLDAISNFPFNCPRLIMKKLPTVESVYLGQSMEQLKQTAQELEGFKWTGVFRKVKDGDYILGAAGGNSVVPVVNRPDLIGEWRVIMEKLPTIKEIYGKELADLRAPDGWRFTGEFRPGKSGEYVLGNRIFAEGYLAVPMNRVTPGMDVEARLILEKLPATPTIREVYGTDEPEIPVGWRVKEFRQIKKYEPVFALEADYSRRNPGKVSWVPDNEGFYGSDRYRLVLEKDPNDPRLLRAMSCTLTPTDVYGPVLPPIPAGWKVVGFRPPVKGEVYIFPNLGKMVDALFEKGYPPVLILAPR